MVENLHYVIGFFVPIAIAGGAGYLFGRWHERINWNELIATGRLPKPTPPPPRDEHGWIHLVVFLRLPEYQHVRAGDARGHEFAIGRHTEGVDWETLEVGDRVRCKIEGTRVLHAQRDKN